MSWPNYGVRYSKAAEAASDAVYAAQANLQAVLRHEYPEGARVRVVHSRGRFYGHVVGWDHGGSRVTVENDHSGKVAKWWAAHVELATGDDA